MGYMDWGVLGKNCVTLCDHFVKKKRKISINVMEDSQIISDIDYDSKLEILFVR